jgi:hypothetical protein
MSATNLVPSPELPEELVGRTLTTGETRLLLGPDWGWVDGARGCASLLVCLRLSVRGSEVRSLKSSDRSSTGRLSS